MTRLPRVSGKEVVQALRRGGFEISHVRGSHHYLKKPGVAALVVVPVHGSRDLPAGTFTLDPPPSEPINRGPRRVVERLGR